MDFGFRVEPIRSPVVRRSFRAPLCAPLLRLNCTNCGRLRDSSSPCTTPHSAARRYGSRRAGLANSDCSRCCAHGVSPTGVLRTLIVITGERPRCLSTRINPAASSVARARPYERRLIENRERRLGRNSIPRRRLCTPARNQIASARTVGFHPNAAAVAIQSNGIGPQRNSAA
jgi:hypothetical protein